MAVSPRVLIVRAPGTNCNEETAFAFEKAGARVTTVHVQSLIEHPDSGSGFQILCFPGGFSYGDDIAAGRILAQRLEVHLPDMLDEFQASDKLILGICNGFQILMRLGVFFPQVQPVAAAISQTPAGAGAPLTLATPATLVQNVQSRFEDRWVHLATADTNCVFLNGIQRMYLPIAHAEGRFVLRNETARQQLEGQKQLGLRYSNPDGEVCDNPLPFPFNPNGADLNIAGISDPSGRIFGLMPHPERHLDPTHHPAWTRREQQPEYGDGMAIFSNAVQYFA